MPSLRFKIGDQVAWAGSPNVLGTVVETRPDWRYYHYTVRWDGNVAWPDRYIDDTEALPPSTPLPHRRNVPKQRKRL